VRLGDAVSLRQADSGLLLCAAAPAAKDHLPLAASEDAKVLAGASAAAAASLGIFRWTLLCPDALTAAFGALERSVNERGAAAVAQSPVGGAPYLSPALLSELQRTPFALPRPVLSAQTRLLLLSHHTPAGPTPAGSSVAASAKEATMRLCVLQTPRPAAPGAAAVEGGATLARRRRMLSSLLVDSVVPLLDPALVRRAAAGGDTQSAASLMATLALFPPRQALFSFVPLHRSHVSTGRSAALGPRYLARPFVPAWASSRLLAASGATGLALADTAQGRRHAALAPRVVAEAAASLVESMAQGAARAGLAPPPPLGSLPLPVQELVLVDALLDALVGVPSPYVRCVATDSDGRAAVPGAASAFEAARGKAMVTVELSSKVAADEYALAGSAGWADRPFAVRFEVVEAPAAPAGVSAPGTPAASVSLRHLAERLLPLGALYAACAWSVSRMSRPDAPAVQQALAHAARTVLKEFRAVVLQLERTSRFGSGKEPAAPVPPHEKYRPGYLRQQYEQWLRTASSNLSLQQMWFFLQPSLRTLQALSDILIACPSTGGGETLNAIAGFVTGPAGGDDVTRSLATFLLNAAAAPYLRWVDGWLFAGSLPVDPHDEFMVSSPTNIPAADTKQGPGVDLSDATLGFALRTKQLPVFLAKHASAILATGRYLNVLKRCQRLSSGSQGAAGASLLSSLQDTLSAQSAWSVVVPHAQPLAFFLDAEAYTTSVSQAYAFAAGELLRHVVSPTDGRVGLLTTLHSLKTFFFTSNGDWVTGFLEAAEAELGKEVSSAAPGPQVATVGRRNRVSTHKVRALLEYALRPTLAANDVHQGSFECVIDPLSLFHRVGSILQAEMPGASFPVPPATSATKGFQAFTLRFHTTWPTSLVLSPVSLEKYEAIFRLVFLLRHAERSVTRCWITHQSCKSLDLRAALAHSYSLRHRMLHFLQNMIYFVTMEVLEPHWHQLVSRIRSAATINDVIASHSEFLRNCLDESLLSRGELLVLLTKLVSLCHLFANQITTIIEQHRLSEDELDRLTGHNRASARAKQERERGTYGKIVDDDADDNASVQGGKRNTQRHGAGANKKPSAQQERDRRLARLGMQNQTMHNAIAQEGWQAMFLKSSRVFESLLGQFLNALTDRARKEFRAHFVHLSARLDPNGFYKAEQ
jgi:gamma-tubulin complex component 2